MIDHRVPAGTLAATNQQLRDVLEDLGIDYCCSDKRTVEDVAAAQGVAMNDLETAIGLATEDVTVPHEEWRTESLTALIAHLEVGHATKAAAVSRIAALAEMVGPATSRQVAFGVLRAAFHRLIIELMPHTEREERVIFPFVLAMEAASEQGATPPQRSRGDLRSLLHPIAGEHRRIQSALSELRSARLELHLDEQDEMALRLFAELRNLTREIHHLMNLETFVLFPRAIALEEKLY
jgi:regulator of cell morphogenesis and NO signaling